MIAVTGSAKKTTFMINRAYMEFVKKAGFEPLLVNSTNDPHIIATLCNGLLLSGGIDVDPIYYLEDNAASFATDIERDKFERELLHAFIALGKPVFGICRGFQLIAREYMNIVPGVANIVNFVQHFGEHSLAEGRSVPRTQPTHNVEVNLSRLYDMPDASSKDVIFVNSMHHQGLFAKLNPKNMQFLHDLGFHTLAATKSGLDKTSNVVIEAFEITGWEGVPIKAVQWHPEELCVTSDRELSLISTFFNQGVQNAGA